MTPSGADKGPLGDTRPPLRELSGPALAVGAILVALAPVILWLMGDVERAGDDFGAPAFLVFVYWMFGKWGVFAFTLGSGLVWILGGIFASSPKAGSLAFLLALLAGSLAGGHALMARGHYVFGGLAYYVAALVISLSLPGLPVRRWASRLVWFGGALVGAGFAAAHGVWRGVAVAAALFAFGAWIALTPKGELRKAKGAARR